MIQTLLFVHIFSSQLLMLHSAVQSRSAFCRGNVTLPCPGVGSDFVSVTWYKQRIEQHKRGILRWSSKDKLKPDFFKSNRSVHYGPDYSLVINAVTPADSGTYECEVGARVGGRNKKEEFKLDVSACVTPAVWTPVTPAVWTPVTPAVRTPVPNTTSDHCRLQVQELPALRIAVVYGTVGLAKIVLSIIIVLIIRCVQTKSSKRRQQKW
ncbi:Peroxidasin like [Dissostichus eleginoides]|uniref:Peroxidasin like n=1 Tax=Dissostichus eleginoides TaxID=100907 RepID=A0AAD9FDE9_DISEL|nr:Peroxidasin like [Dissostichus eleginoides]